MKYWLPLLLFTPLSAWADDTDLDGFRSCALSEEAPTTATVYHHCAAQMVASCGASKTAAEATACIDAAGQRLERRRLVEFDALIAEDPAPTWLPEGGVATVGALIELSVNNGKGSCLLVADRDEKNGVAVGQRAVNGAFCNLVVEGDAYGLLVNMGRQG